MVRVHACVRSRIPAAIFFAGASSKGKDRTLRTFRLGFNSSCAYQRFLFNWQGWSGCWLTAESFLRSHPRREAGASSRLISGRDRLSPGSRLDTWGGDQMPGLSSGDGASPTKKISGVRSSTPAPIVSGSVPLVEVDLPFKQDAVSSSLTGPTKAL